MSNLITKALRDLFYENDMLSLTRVISFAGYLLFGVGSLYLMINQINWSGYDVFAAYTGGGGAMLQFGNKFINSKYNTVSGGYEQTNGSPINPRSDEGLKTIHTQK